MLPQEYLDDMCQTILFTESCITDARNGDQCSLNLLLGGYSTNVGYVLRRPEIDFITLSDLRMIEENRPEMGDSIQVIRQYMAENPEFAAVMADPEY